MDKIKYVVREVPAEWAALGYYFDGDCFNGSDDFLNTLLIVSDDGWGRLSGLNIAEYKRIMEQAETVLDGFLGVSDGELNYDGEPITYADVLGDAGIAGIDADALRRLVKWAEDASADNTQDIADLLTIITGHYWTTAAARGYCQGDYAEMVYCPERYADGVEAYGEIWLGCAKEFQVIYLDDDGTEGDSVSGFIVADCQAWRDEDYKRIVCGEADIPEDETRLEMIDGYHVRTVYDYRTA